MSLPSYEYTPLEHFYHQFETLQLLQPNSVSFEKEDQTNKSNWIFKMRNSPQNNLRQSKQAQISLFPIQLCLIVLITIALDGLIEILPYHNPFLTVIIHFFNFLFAYIVIIITEGQGKDKHKISNKKDHIISFLVLYKYYRLIKMQSSPIYHDLCSIATFYSIYFSTLYPCNFGDKLTLVLLSLHLLLVLQFESTKAQVLILAFYYLSSKNNVLQICIDQCKQFYIYQNLTGFVSYYTPLLYSNSQFFQKYTYPKIFWLLYSLILFITFSSLQCLENLHWVLVWVAAVIIGSSRFQSISYLKERYKIILVISFLVLLGQWIIICIGDFNHVEEMKYQINGFYLANIIVILILQLFLYIQQLVNEGSLFLSYFSTILLLPSPKSRISKDPIYERSLNYMLISIRVISFVALVIAFMFNSYFTFFHHKSLQSNMYNSFGFIRSENLFLFSKQFGYFVFFCIPLSFYKFTSLFDEKKFSRGQYFSRFLKNLCYILSIFSFLFEIDVSQFRNTPLKVIKPWSEQMDNLYNLWYSIQRCQQTNTFYLFTLSHILSFIILLSINLKNGKQQVLPLFGKSNITIKMSNLKQKCYSLSYLLAYAALFLKIYEFQCTRVQQWAILFLQIAILVISYRIQ